MLGIPRIGLVFWSLEELSFELGGFIGCDGQLRVSVAVFRVAVERSSECREGD